MVVGLLHYAVEAFLLQVEDSVESELLVLDHFVGGLLYHHVEGLEQLIDVDVAVHPIVEHIEVLHIVVDLAYLLGQYLAPELVGVGDVLRELGSMVAV